MQESVAIFLDDLRRVLRAGSGDAALLEQVKPLLRRLAQSTSWRRPEHYECNPEQGFGVHVLHEEPDHSLWLVAVSWLPKRGAPPHNHGTWAVVAGVDGVEENILWRRRDGRLERQATETIGPGEVCGFLGNAIHSVTNPGSRTTLSLHVYGTNLNRVARSQFDAATGAEAPFKVKVQ